MADPAILRQDGTVVQRHARQVDVIVPYAGTGAYLHVYAAEIAGELHAAATDPGHELPLSGIVLEFHAAYVQIIIRGSELAQDFWLADLRIVKQLQNAINEIRDRHLSRQP